VALESWFANLLDTTYVILPEDLSGRAEDGKKTWLLVQENPGRLTSTKHGCTGINFKASSKGCPNEALFMEE
jgi:hypothetical protein